MLFNVVREIKMDIIRVLLLIFFLQVVYAKDHEVVNRGAGTVSKQAEPKGMNKVVLKPTIRYIDRGQTNYKFDDFSEHLEMVICLDEQVASKLPVVLQMNFKRFMADKDAEFFTVPLEDTTSEYSIIRKIKTYKHPITKKTLGSLYTIVGDAKVLETTNLSRMKVTNINSSILIKDKIISKRHLILNKNIKLVEKDITRIGTIIGGLYGKMEFGKYDNVILDFGSDANVTPGNMFDVIQFVGNINFFNKNYTKTTLKNKNINYVGQILIYQVFEHLSIGIVVDSLSSIFVNDQVV